MFVIKEIIKGVILGITLANPKKRNAYIKKQFNKLEKRVMS